MRAGIRDKTLRTKRSSARSQHVESARASCLVEPTAFLSCCSDKRLEAVHDVGEFRRVRDDLGTRGASVGRPHQMGGGVSNRARWSSSINYLKRVGDFLQVVRVPLCATCTSVRPTTGTLCEEQNQEKMRNDEQHRWSFQHDIAGELAVGLLEFQPESQTFFDRTTCTRQLQAGC